MLHDDFPVIETSTMHMKEPKPDHCISPPKHHHHTGSGWGSNMHVMKPRRCDPPPKHNCNTKKHGYGGYHGNNYSETISEQEEKPYKYDQHHGHRNKRFYAFWFRKRIDD